jgi:hypothetical protein
LSYRRIGGNFIEAKKGVVCGIFVASKSNKKIRDVLQEK